ncbi:MAG: hypothetical protein E7212_08630 [Clostridium sartagoforme]|nr:hypothetical protein [Clostridium sartagoforme]
MNYETIEGVKYYWISYKNIEDELPFLCLGKRSIMMRMLKLRDIGLLSHYTKKEAFRLGVIFKRIYLRKKQLRHSPYVIPNQIYLL